MIRLQCLAHGTPPLTFSWTRLDGRLPPRAVVNGGDLQINLATADDAGSYKCVASNSVGSSQVVAKVTVRCEFTPRIRKYRVRENADPRLRSPPGGPSVASGGGEGSGKRRGVHLFGIRGRGYDN